MTRAGRAKRLAAVGAALALPLAMSLVPAFAQSTASRLARVEVLDTMVLPGVLPGGMALREASGLAWDKVGNHLLMVTDRGLIVRWMLDIEYRRLVSAWPVRVHEIAANQRVNAESVDIVPPDGPGATQAMLVVDEKRNVVFVVDERGKASATVPLSAALYGGAQREAEADNGIEAIAWHPRHGVLAARQRPTAAEAAQGVHRVFAADGRAWALRATPGARSSIKAMHLLTAERLLVLEKLSDGSRRRSVLRELDLRECTVTLPCDPSSAVIDDPTLRPDDNFEGLACPDTDLCLVVSDDGRRPDRRTVLTLLHLQRR